MKLIKGILGCALAAGLTTFAANQAQAGAGTVIDGELYSIVNLKLVVNYEGDNGKISKKTVTSKQVLKDIGYSSNVALAIDSDYDFYVINTKNKTILEYLTEEGAMTATNLTSIVYAEKETQNTYTETSLGTLGILFNDDNADEDINYDYFYVTGSYSGSVKYNDQKNGNYKESTSVKVSGLAGKGYFEQIDDDALVTGSATVKGSGTLVGE